MNIYEQIMKARAEALRHNIRANSILLNENIALVRQFWFPFNNQIEYVPRMICGLFANLSNELPDDYTFIIYEDKNPPKTREQEIKAEARKELIKEISNMTVNEIQELINGEIDNEP